MKQKSYSNSKQIKNNNSPKDKGYSNNKQILDHSKSYLLLVQRKKKR